MDYTDFRNREVVAYFTKERNIFAVQGKLERADSEYLIFKNADVTIVNNGEEFSHVGFSGNELNEKEEKDDDGSDFSEVRFKESDLVGICRAKN